MDKKALEYLANLISQMVYQQLIATTKISRIEAIRMAANAANKAAQSLELDLSREVSNAD